jgi:hypothetical protein
MQMQARYRKAHLATLRQQLTDDFKDVFPAELPNQLPPARAIEHEIRLMPGHETPCKPHYRLSNDDLDRSKKLLDDRLSTGMISPANFTLRCTSFLCTNERWILPNGYRLPRPQQTHRPQ